MKRKHSPSCHGAPGPQPVRVGHSLAVITIVPDGIASTFVLLDKDRALHPDHQKEQAKNAEVDELLHFDSGHSAVASKPAEWAKLLPGYLR